MRSFRNSELILTRTLRSTMSVNWVESFMIRMRQSCAICRCVDGSNALGGKISSRCNATSLRCITKCSRYTADESRWKGANRVICASPGHDDGVVGSQSRTPSIVVLCIHSTQAGLQKARYNSDQAYSQLEPSALYSTEVDRDRAICLVRSPITRMKRRDTHTPTRFAARYIIWPA